MVMVWQLTKKVLDMARRVSIRDIEANDDTIPNACHICPNPAGFVEIEGRNVSLEYAQTALRLASKVCRHDSTPCCV